MLKRWAANTLAALPPASWTAQRLSRLACPIFMFHRVLRPGEICYDPAMATSVELFSEFLDWVSSRYQVVPLRDLIRLNRHARNGSKPYCSLTFDDGWCDNFTHAFPLLRARELPAAIFLPVRFIGTNRRFWQEKLQFCLEALSQRNELEAGLGSAMEAFPWCPKLAPSDMTFSSVRRVLLRRSSLEAEAFVSRIEESARPVLPLEGRAFLNWSEVRIMQNEGISFGSHTLNHTLLTGADLATSSEEIYQSRRELTDRLGAPPEGFSYPWGAANAHIERLVREAGYEFAVATQGKLVRGSVERWSVPRMAVSSEFLADTHQRFSPSRTSLCVAGEILKGEARGDWLSKQMRPAAAPLRIAFVIDSIDRWEDGGTEQQIAKLIAALNSPHFDVRLYFLRPSSGLMPSDFPCPVYAADAAGPVSGSRLRTLVHLIEQFRRWRPHIVQTFFRDATYYGVIAARLARVPVIVIARRNFGHWKTFADRMALKLVNRMAKSWQCNSRTVGDYLENVERVRSDRIEILPNAIDLHRFLPATFEERTHAREMLGLSSAAPVFVCVATLHPVKDPLTLVEAAALVRRRIPEAQFILVGEGPLRGALEENIKRLNLETNVHLVGAQSDVRPFLAAADIGLLTSRSEGSSNSILEYMALGLPVVVSDLPANLELVQGCFFEAASAPDLAERIIALWNDLELRNRMGEENRCRVIEYSLEVFARRAQSYYLRLL